MPRERPPSIPVSLAARENRERISSWLKGALDRRRMTPALAEKAVPIDARGGARIMGRIDRLLRRKA